MTIDIQQVNRVAGLVATVQGRPNSVWILDIVDDRVRQIHVVRNPDKLGSLAALDS